MFLRIPSRRLPSHAMSQRLRVLHYEHSFYRHEQTFLVFFLLDCRCEFHLPSLRCSLNDSLQGITPMTVLLPYSISTLLTTTDRTTASLENIFFHEMIKHYIQVDSYLRITDPILSLEYYSIVDLTPSLVVSTTPSKE